MNTRGNLLGDVGAWALGDNLDSKYTAPRTHQPPDYARRYNTRYRGPTSLDLQPNDYDFLAGSVPRPNVATLVAAAENVDVFPNVPILPRSRNAQGIFETIADGSAHSSAGTFACEVCSKELRDSATLRHHKMTHDPHKKAQHKCPVCFRGFPYPKDVKRHLSQHNKRRIICKEPDCGKSYTRVDNLKRHAKIHGGGTASAGTPSLLGIGVMRENEATASAHASFAASMPVNPVVKSSLYPERPLMGRTTAMSPYSMSGFSSRTLPDQNANDFSPEFVDIRRRHASQPSYPPWGC